SVTPPGCRRTPTRFTRSIAANSSWSPAKNYSSATRPKRPARWLKRHTRKIRVASVVTSIRRKWLESMRINGEWLLCEDGVSRPVIRGRIQARDGSWIITEFLVDTGADRTVLNARILRELGLPPLEPEEDISGLGGMTDSVVVETRLLLTRDTGPPV